MKTFSPLHSETEMALFDDIFVARCIGYYQNDNFLCSQWWKFHQNGISVSVPQAICIANGFAPNRRQAITWTDGHATQAAVVEHIVLTFYRLVTINASDYMD